jgi:hypothetical protein
MMLMQNRAKVHSEERTCKDTYQHDATDFQSGSLVFSLELCLKFLIAKRLEFPDDVERGEVQIVRRVMALQRSGERPAPCTEGTGSGVHPLPGGASGYITINLVLEASAVSQLAIES